MYSLNNISINEKIVTQLIEQLGLLLTSNYKLVIDSRKISIGNIFCAYPGVTSDGRNFIDTAVENGARAILWEPGIDFNYNLENYSVSNLMQMVGILAAKQYNFPSDKLVAIGVTGTNGKTSISHWLNQAFSFLGKSSAIIGTTGAGIYPNIVDYASTTPDPITLQSLLSDFVHDNVDVVAMEVSSHALDQGRVNGVKFSSAVFTNLTQDHLDYHQNMENYFQAKEQLFYWFGLKSAIINVDDKYGERLINKLNTQNDGLNVISYGIKNGDIRASNIELTLQGVIFDLSYKNSVVRLSSPVLGMFNVYNLLAVCATLLANDVSWDILPAILSNLKPVIGRMDAQIVFNKPLVVVDFAHSPDALENALKTLRDLEGINQLICVFGCGGNRDKLKRPIMGQIATNLADNVIITSDNPRNEKASDIINDIVAGINLDNYMVIEERQQAIEYAIKNAKHNDVILIAGKGHEEYQEINGVKYPFSDLKLVKNLLNIMSPNIS